MSLAQGLQAISIGVYASVLPRVEKAMMGSRNKRDSLEPLLRSKETPQSANSSGTAGAGLSNGEVSDKVDQRSETLHAVDNVPTESVQITSDNKKISEAWTVEDESIICGPYNYVANLPGKDFRGQLMRAMNRWLQISENSFEKISRAIEMLHNASLLYVLDGFCLTHLNKAENLSADLDLSRIDDIQDSSTLRRGLSSAHMVFGVAQTINSGNYMYFRAMDEIRSLDNPRLLHVFIDELLHLHRGQGLDLYWRDTSICPTEEEYIRMVSDKTGGLFRLAFRCMWAESPQRIRKLQATDALSFSLRAAVSSGSSPETVVVRTNESMILHVLNTLSQIFQIADDYKNLRSSDYTATKGFAEDLTEGKFSFPIICAIHASGRQDHQIALLRTILKQQTNDVEVKKMAITIVEQANGFEMTRQTIRALQEEANATLHQLDLAGAGACCKAMRGMMQMILTGMNTE